MLQNLPRDDDVEGAIPKGQPLDVEVVTTRVDPTLRPRPLDCVGIHVDAHHLVARGIHLGERAVAAPDIEEFEGRTSRPAGHSFREPSGSVRSLDGKVVAPTPRVVLAVIFSNNVRHLPT